VLGDYAHEALAGVGNLVERARRSPTLEVENPRVELIYTCLFSLSSVVVRREILDQVGGCDETFSPAADWDLWLRMAEAGIRTMGIHEPMIRYRRHGANMSKNSLSVCAECVCVLEKNWKLTKFTSDFQHYRRALQDSRCRLELAKARSLLETHPDGVAPAIFRAWYMNPCKIKWLLRWAGVVWPRVLGGALTSAYAFRKLREKFEYQSREMNPASSNRRLTQDR